MPRILADGRGGFIPGSRFRPLPPAIHLGAIADEPPTAPPPSIERCGQRSNASSCRWTRAALAPLALAASRGRPTDAAAIARDLGPRRWQNRPANRADRIAGQLARPRRR